MPNLVRSGQRTTCDSLKNGMTDETEKLIDLDYVFCIHLSLSSLKDVMKKAKEW